MSNPPKPEKSFCWPIHRLENTRLILEPWQMSVHAPAFVSATKDDSDLFQYLEYGPFATAEEFTSFLGQMTPEDTALFAILVKPEADQDNDAPKFAGILALLDANPKRGTVEIGVTIVPAYRRTFVTTNAVGLLLLYTLDLPPSGLGLRRVTWQSNAKNEASRRVATRMGFTFECVQRFQRTVAEGKVDNGVDAGFLGDGLGGSRDTALFAHYCDQWAGRRGEVLRVMERR